MSIHSSTIFAGVHSKSDVYPGSASNEAVKHRTSQATSVASKPTGMLYKTGELGGTPNRHGKNM